MMFCFITCVARRRRVVTTWAPSIQPPPYSPYMDMGASTLVARGEIVTLSQTPLFFINNPQWGLQCWLLLPGGQWHSPHPHSLLTHTHLQVSLPFRFLLSFLLLTSHKWKSTYFCPLFDRCAKHFSLSRFQTNRVWAISEKKSSP